MDLTSSNRKTTQCVEKIGLSDHATTLGCGQMGVWEKQKNDRAFRAVV